MGGQAAHEGLDLFRGAASARVGNGMAREPHLDPLEPRPRGGGHGQARRDAVAEHPFRRARHGHRGLARGQ
jgi:hypothetical protein